MHNICYISYSGLKWIVEIVKNNDVRTPAFFGINNCVYAITWILIIL